MLLDHDSCDFGLEHRGKYLLQAEILAVFRQHVNESPRQNPAGATPQSSPDFAAGSSSDLKVST